MTLSRSISLLLLLAGKAASLIGEDGLCSLHIYVPFTLDGVENLAFAETPNLTNNGMSQLAAAAMAVRHFNERNATAVSELGDFIDCPIQLDIDNSLVFNTDADPFLSSRYFFEESIGADTNSSGSIPCAMVGPFHDAPAAELSSMATAAQIPLITARSFDSSTVSDLYSPFTSSVFPDIVSSPNVIVDYLLYLNRTDFIALLYPLENLGFQRREAFGLEFDERGIRWTSSPYFGQDAESTDAASRSYFAAMQRILESGYRTVVVSLRDPFTDLRPIAEAAEELGMNDGQYLYVFVDIFDPSLLFDDDPIVRKLIEGAAWVIPLSEDLLFFNSFFSSWLDQGQGTVDILNQLNPLTQGEEGFVDAQPDYYQTAIPEYGCAFMYDAVMTSGIGACTAWNLLNATKPRALSGLDHQLGVRQSNFRGASGEVTFGSPQFTFLGGTRKPGTVIWSSLNIRTPELGIFSIVHWNIPGEDSGWERVGNATEFDFIFAMGLPSRHCI